MPASIPDPASPGAGPRPEPTTPPTSATSGERLMDLSGTVHPAWCSPEHCEVRPDHPGLGDHRSEPVVIAPAAGNAIDPTVTLWLSQFGYEAPAAAVTVVVIHLEGWSLSGQIEEPATYGLRTRTAAQISALLTELATIGGTDDMTPDMTSPMGPQGRCAAAHVEDMARCEGPADAVRIVDQAGAEVTGCVRHGAVLLASLEGGRVYPGPGARQGDAIEVFRAARHLPPFAFERESGTRVPNFTTPDMTPDETQDQDDDTQRGEGRS